MPILPATASSARIALDNHERENAFGEAEVRLLQHRGGEHGRGAGERAQLFDETQRLLKETEQRNAELAVINSIQQGMAASAETSRPSSTWWATGCARCSHTDNIGIRWYDARQPGCIHTSTRTSAAQRAAARAAAGATPRRARSTS